MATTLTRDGGGCSGGHVIYLSPYYPPTSLCPRVRVLYLLLTSYLLQAASPRGAILGTPTISLLFVPLSFFPAQAPSSSRSREETGTRFPPFLRPLFLFVSPIFRLLPQRLHSALPLYPPTSLFLPLCPLFSSFFHYFYSVLTDWLEYFDNYSGKFRVRFFVPKLNILCSYYSPFFFCLYLYSNINKCESNCEKPANEYDAATIPSFSWRLIAG